MKRRVTALVLFLLYGAFLTYMITFGRETANMIQGFLKEEIDSAMHDVTVTDVEINLSFEETYLVEKTYYPQYTAIGDIKHDAGLVFEALDDTIIVGSNGSFHGVRTDQTLTTGRIRITSSFDLDFEKVITVRFEKKYPSEYKVSFYQRSVGVNPKKIYVGIPLYLYSSVPSGVLYSEKDYTIEYDPAYFEQVGKNCVIPIRATEAGEQITLRYVYGNGDSKETVKMTIHSTPEVESFDEIYFSKENVEETSFLVNTASTVYLYRDGKRVYSDFEIIAPEAAGLKYNSLKNPYFTNPGTFDVTFRLPNGFSKTVKVTVHNLLEYPTFEGMHPEEPIQLTLKDKYTFSYHFSKGMTYRKLNFEYDESMLTVSTSGNVLTLTGKVTGETELKISIDDGEQHVERVYRVVITDEHALGTLLLNNLSNIVSKGLGHMGGFFVLAAFSLNLFYALQLRRRFLMLTGYVFSGLFFGCLTEFIQFFMPTRDCALEDVGVDMIGFLAGTLFFLLLALLVIWGKKGIEKLISVYKCRRKTRGDKKSALGNALAKYFGKRKKVTGKETELSPKVTVNENEVEQEARETVEQKKD